MRLTTLNRGRRRRWKINNNNQSGVTGFGSWIAEAENCMTMHASAMCIPKWQSACQMNTIQPCCVFRNDRVHAKWTRFSHVVYPEMTERMPNEHASAMLCIPKWQTACQMNTLQPCCVFQNDTAHAKWTRFSHVVYSEKTERMPQEYASAMLCMPK